MNSPLQYIGGKSRLAKTIINMIPQHTTYCEVFAGAAWVFFRKEISRHEIINDLDSDLVNFYRVLQNHLEEFLRQFKWLLSSREWFEDWKSQIKARGLTDIQRAARYYYLQRHSFAGHVTSQYFGVSKMKGPRINLLRLEEELSTVHLRLSRVVIENLPWEQCVKRYDASETFFYIDPPYYLAPYYRHNLELRDYERMADILAQVDAKFVMSLNSHPDMLRIFERFNIRRVNLRYTASKTNFKRVTELLISNF